MDKVKLGLFDVFGYLIPGMVFLLSLMLFYDGSNDFVFIRDLIPNSVELMKKITDEHLFAVVTIVALLVSFVLGFVGQVPGVVLFERIYMFCRIRWELQWQRFVVASLKFAWKKFKGKSKRANRIPLAAFKYKAKLHYRKCSDY